MAAAGVDGKVEPGFEGVRDAFARNFAEHGEIGAAFCLYVDGRAVVDVWGGVADADTGRAYEEDTLQLVFSTTKGLTAMCAAKLMEEGKLDVEAPVSEYWPEFSANGKGDIPVRWLLSHKAGLYTVDRPPAYADTLRWDPIVDALAEQAPLWEPGQKHGYHALTYGWLVGEVIRRITGMSIGAYFRQAFGEPLGLDTWIGLPSEHHGRVAPLVGGLAPQTDDPEMLALIESMMGPDTVLGKALGCSGALDPGDGSNAFNRPDLWSAEIPAAAGITTARSLAKVYGSLVGSVDGHARTLSPETVEAVRADVNNTGADEVLSMQTRFGLGFMLSTEFSPFGGPGSFGHPGAGGSVGFAHPEKNIGFGYVMNKMQANLSGDPRVAGITQAVYAAL
jgi:CubicO group peptidase (beta-lactamase class C family)